MDFFSTRRLICLIFCCVLGLVSRVSAQNDPVCFQLFFPTVAAEPGDTVCVPMMVRDFELIVAMQFVTRWDTASLELLNLDYYVDSDLPTLEAWNFFLGPIGKLAFSWDDITGMGVTLPDSAALFTLCFRVKNGTAGLASVYIDRTSQPIYDVVQVLPPNWDPVSMPFAYQPGGVAVGMNTPSDLAITSMCVSTAICNAAVGVATITVSGGLPPYTYFWSGPNGFSDTLANLEGVSSGIYSLTVTDQNGSTISAVTFIKSTPISIYSSIESTTDAFCGQPNGCASLNVSGSNPPFSFQWSSGNSQTAENCELVPGEHFVSISDNQGCIKVVSFYIQNEEYFSLGLSYQHIYECLGTGYLKASIYQPQNYTYLWSTGDTTEAIDSLSAGVYSITVTSIGGCTRHGSFEIQDKTTQNWDLELLPVCTPEDELTGNLLLQFNISGDMAFPATVAWSDGTTRLITENTGASNILDTLAEMPSGHYAVTVTDAGGCSLSLSKVLYCEPLPDVPSGFPAFYIKDEYLTPQYATDSCAGVYARNLDGISGLAFSLAWTPYLGEFKEIRNINLPGLTLSDFTIMQDEGILGVQWSSANPVLLPTEILLFEVCLNAKNNAQVSNLNFRDKPTGPKYLDEFGTEQPFIGRSGDLLFGLYFPPGPSVCDFAALPLDCAFDGKARIALGSCDPDKFLTGECARKDSTGIFQHYGDLSRLLFADEGTYYINARQAASNYNQFLAHIPNMALSPECVWPGDADNNNAVNHHDLLYIGLAHGTVGEQRTNASPLWLGQDCADWIQTTSVRYVNYKNIDSNGDGIINAADTTAIVQNWGRVINPAMDNPFGSPQGNPTGAQHPMLALESDTLEAGEAVALPLSLGTENMPMDSVYGIAFSISYDPELVKDQVFFKPSSSWFGDSTQYLFLQKNFPKQGHLDVAITRTDGIPVSGWGAIGNVFIIIEDNIFGAPDPLAPDTTLKTNLFFSGLHSVTANETSQGLGAIPTELVIRRTTSGVHNLPNRVQNISISPNPASETLLISSKETNMLYVEISTISGKVLKQMSIDSNTVQVPVGSLPSGAYFLRIFTEKGVTIKQLQIAH